MVGSYKRAFQLILLLWFFALAAQAQPLDLLWEKETNYNEYPSGRIRVATIPVALDHLGGETRVRAYLPPGYDSDDNSKRYPVLYVLDGQEVFQTGGLGGDWLLDEKLDELIAGGRMAPIIAVTIDTPPHEFRVRYMTSLRTINPGNGQAEGEAATDLVTLLRRVKAGVDDDFNTDVEDTGLIGSSLGGLFALHAGFKHPAEFDRVAALSPALWWGKRDAAGGEVLISDARISQGPDRLWLDMGDNEFSNEDDPLEVQQQEAAENVSLTASLAAAIKGHRDDERPFGFRSFDEEDRDDHNPTSWSNRLPEILPFLYPAP